MDLLVSVKTLDMLLKFLKGDLKNLGTNPYQPQRPLRPMKKSADPLPRSAPELQGMDSRRLAAFVRELAAAEDICPHNLLVLRHGQVVLQGSFAPYTPDYPHMMYSMSKSVTATAVGLAVEEGLLSLDERITDLFADRLSPVRALINPRMRRVTVRHLLNMSAGVAFNEVGTVLEKDWLRAYLESEVLFEPGSRFYYNSLNTYVLSEILTKKTGLGLMDYCTPRLFAPLGITNLYWETSPTGIAKGGWGLNLLIEDMAKLGQLYLNRGSWTRDGVTTQLVPAHWIDEATKPHITDQQECPFGYGYQIWGCPIEGAYQFNGVFGQYVIVLPKEDVVLALTCGSSSLFPQGAVMRLVGDYFAKPQHDRAPLSQRDRAAERVLSETLKHLECGRPLPPEEKPDLKKALDQLSENFKAALPLLRQPAVLTSREQRIDGKTYHLEPNLCSLLPLILQGVYNNYARGITKLSCAYTNGELGLSVTEETQTNRLRVGFQKALTSKLCFRKDHFTVATRGEWTTDEDDFDVLRLSVFFLETPDIRKIKLIFQKDNLIVKMDESPRVAKALHMAVKLFSGVGGNLENQLNAAITKQQLRESIRRLVTPIAQGRDASVADPADPWEGL